jgi:hypothetical protein
MLWIWFYALLVFQWTYWCTRGPDGDLMATIVGFSVIGILYWLTLYWCSSITVGALLQHLVILEFAVTIALVVVSWSNGNRSFGLSELAV